MFCELRRKKQQPSEQECTQILDKELSGVLATFGDEGYPYIVPLNYYYENSKVYFHCAKTGHKINTIKKNSNVSFCVVSKETILPEAYATSFRSVIVFGKVRIIEDDEQKRVAIRRIAKKYAPKNSEQRLHDEIARDWQSLCILELTIEHMSGKESLDLARMKRDGQRS